MKLIRMGLITVLLTTIAACNLPERAAKGAAKEAAREVVQGVEKIIKTTDTQAALEALKKDEGSCVIVEVSGEGANRLIRAARIKSPETEDSQSNDWCSAPWASGETPQSAEDESIPESPSST